MDHTPKKQFVVGTVLSATDPRNIAMINALKEQYVDRDIVVLPFNNLSEDAKKNFTADKLDVVIYDNTSYRTQDIQQLVQNVNENKANSEFITPIFINIIDGEPSNSPKALEIKREALEIKRELKQQDIISDIENFTKTKTLISTGISVNSLYTEKVRIEKSKEELDKIAKDLQESMNQNEDTYTPTHLENTSAIAVKIAGKMGFSESDMEILELGTLLHDFGKSFLPKDLLEKEGTLSDEEFDMIKSHVVCGQVKFSNYDLGDFERVKNIIGQHHERYDGTGYPNKLKGYSNRQSETATEKKITGTKDMHYQTSNQIKKLVLEATPNASEKDKKEFEDALKNIIKKKEADTLKTTKEMIEALKKIVPKEKQPELIASLTIIIIEKEKEKRDKIQEFDISIATEKQKEVLDRITEKFPEIKEEDKSKLSEELLTILKEKTTEEEKAAEIIKSLNKIIPEYQQETLQSDINSLIIVGIRTKTNRSSC